MFTAWAITGKPDVGFTLNGVLAGLVGITAGTASIGFGASILVGAIGGVIMVFSVIGLERAGFDDPVGAISVHGSAGLWGVLAVGIFGGGNLIDQAIGAGRYREFRSREEMEPGIHEDRRGREFYPSLMLAVALLLALELALANRFYPKKDEAVEGAVKRFKEGSTSEAA